MGEWIASLVALPFIAALLLSGVWASKRFAHHRKLPAHFDLTGQPTRMAPRSVVVWLLPILYSLTLLLMSMGIAFAPTPQGEGGNVAETGLIALILLATQALVLRLMVRWDRKL